MDKLKKELAQTEEIVSFWVNAYKTIEAAILAEEKIGELGVEVNGLEANIKNLRSQKDSQQIEVQRVLDSLKKERVSLEEYKAKKAEEMEAIDETFKEKVRLFKLKEDEEKAAHEDRLKSIRASLKIEQEKVLKAKGEYEGIKVRTAKLKSEVAKLTE